MVSYEAEQRSLRRDVAVKVLHEEEVVGWNLVLEGRIAGGIEHPNIVPVHALVLGPEGRPMLVMKRLTGVSWDDLVQDPDAPMWGQLLAGGGDRLGVHLELAIAACNALAAAHDKGILHLDVKPANVVVSGRPR